MTPADLEAYARALAEQNGLDPDFVAAIGKAESGFKPDAVSKKGALGPMQLMPATAKDLGVNPADPFDNIRGGVQYLAQLHKQFGGDPTLTAAAYNAGPGAVQKAGGVPNFPETQAYVAKVTKPAEIDASKVQWDEAPQSIDASKVQWDAPAQAKPDEVPLQAAAIAGGRGLDRLAAGLRQAVPEGVRSAVDALGSKLGMAEPPSIDPAVQAANTAAYKKLQEQQPLATLAGELPQMVAAKTPLGMAALGGLEYGTPAERAINAGANFIGGKAGEYAMKGLSRLITPFQSAGTEAAQAVKDLFARNNVSPLPSQVTGSKPLALMESVVANTPGGSSMRQAMMAQREGLGAATMKAMGGEGSAVTPEAVQAAQSTVGGRIGDISKGVPTIPTDDTLLNALANVEQRYGNKLDALQRPVVQKLIDQISSAPAMSGEFYQATRSDIAAMARGASGSYQNALTDIYKSLDRAFDRAAGPDAAKAMAQARTEYTAGKTLGKLASESGSVSPAKAGNMARFLPPAARDVSALGDAMRGLPDSFTPSRALMQSLLSGGVGLGATFATGDPSQGFKWGAGTAAAQLAGPWLASQLLTSKAGRAYLTNGVLSPEVEKLLVQLGAGSGGLLGAQAPRALGLLGSQ